MTAATRERLRHAIDAEKRRRLARARGPRGDCEYCGKEFTPQPHPGGHPQRFCCANHRKQAWYRDTEIGRATRNRLQRQRLARRKAEREQIAA